MKMFNEDNHGFTLIELIMVIVILGILAAVIVPKYYDFTSRAEDEVEATFIGGLKSGINLFSINKLLTTGAKTFPMRSSMLYEGVLDEIPEDWTYEAEFGRIKHTRTDGSMQEWYYWTNSDSTIYGIAATFGSGDGNAQITICHIPPGNPNNPQTITIAQSAWPAHQAHGDYLGSCN